MRLLPAERFALTIICALALLDAVLLMIKGVQIDVPGYARVLSIGGLLIAFGQFYRRYRSNEGIALATTAAGLFIVFTIMGSVFNYLLLPVNYGSLDMYLTLADEHLGFSWVAVLDWVASVPGLGTVLRYVYLSSLPQMIAVILLLGFTKSERELHQFLLTGLIGALITICVWAMAPSFGAMANHQLSAATNAKLQIVVGFEYGVELKRLAAEGVTRISPDDALGLIGFPSFHTVMACLSVWFMTGFKRVWLFFVAINLIMVLAIIVHGGHHFFDVLGGLGVFAASLWLSKQALRQLDAGPQAGARLPANAG
jgi:PAP2 superfamily